MATIRLSVSEDGPLAPLAEYEEAMTDFERQALADVEHEGVWSTG